MNFSPTQKHIQTLLNDFSEFRIPVFQRDYSWDKHYYSSFLNDIVDRIEIKEDKAIPTQYFLGTMVFSGEENAPVDVVDGQQRLTVITILFSVLCDLFNKNNKTDLADGTFRYIKYKNHDGEVVTKLYSDTTYPFFDYYIQSLDKEEKYSKANSEEEENLKKTYLFFLDQLSSENVYKNFPKFHGVDHTSVLKAIRDQVFNSKCISILTPNKESAYMIFEILNAKGKNLASIDLIKNKILESVHDNISGGEAKVVKHWEGIKSILRSRDVDTGFATFYRHFWLSKYKKVTSTALYDDFIKQTKKDKDYISFLHNLENEAINYVVLVDPRREDFENRQQYFPLVDKLKTIQSTFGIVQTRILFLTLFDLKHRDLISLNKFIEVVTFIENYIFSRIILGKQRTNIFEKIFSAFSIKARKLDNKLEINELINKDLYSKLNVIKIDFDDFVDSFSSLTYSKRNEKVNTLTKYVLKNLNNYYNKREHFRDDFSVEHIISEKLENPKVFNIGNLIALEKNYNEDAGDLEYVDKRYIYNKSDYNEVKQFVDKYHDFKIDDIDQRAKDLALVYYENILNK